MLGVAWGFKIGGTIAEYIAAGTAAIPQFNIGGSGAFGSPVATVEAGGEQVSKVSERVAAAIKSTADIISDAGELIGKGAEYERRFEGWVLERDIAAKEKEQIDLQIQGAQKQLAISEKEIGIYDKTFQQTKEIGDFFKSKFTNKSLYNWMVSRLSGLYFQAYKIAFDMAKLAERAYQYEFGTNDTYINFGHWDSRRKGLLAGESLLLDLQRLDKAAIAQDSRYLEITKTISLARLDPIALLELRDSGTCQFSLNELIFDRDYPGHYFRIIKSVSISIPAIVGPYQTVKATLSQTGHKTVLKPDINAVKFLMGDEEVTDMPDSIRADWRANQQIAVSTGIDDSGMFELNFEDDRYLPFEGTGAVSYWLLEMPKATNPIDFDPITDVVIHLKYMCKTDGGLFKQNVMELERFKNYSGIRMFSFAHEFTTQWHAFKNDAANINDLEIQLPAGVFPHNVNVDIESIGTDRISVFHIDSDGMLTEAKDQFDISLPSTER